MLRDQAAYLQLLVKMAEEEEKDGDYSCHHIKKQKNKTLFGTHLSSIHDSKSTRTRAT